MTDKQEKLYLEGERAAYNRLLGLALKGLGYEGTAAEAARHLLEREAIVAQLRILCRDFGDNDWEPSLNLADVIDKHLGRHLHENYEPNE